MSVAAKVNVSCAKNSIFNLQASCHPTPPPHTHTHTHTDAHTHRHTVNRPCPMAWVVFPLARVPGRALYVDTYTCPRRSSFTPPVVLCSVVSLLRLRLCHCLRLHLCLRLRCDRLRCCRRDANALVDLDYTPIVENAQMHCLQRY